MRDWLSAQDLADLGLPGLPTSKSGWHRYAEHAGWLAQTDKVRAREERAGGLEFHIDLLPPATLAAYVAKHVGAVDLKAPDAAAAGREEEQRQLTLPAVETRDARLALLAAVHRLARDGNMSRNMADRVFVALYHMGEIEVPPWVRQACLKISPRTLRRWRTLKSYDGISRLGVDKGAARRGKGRLESGEEGKVRAFLLAAIAKQPHLTSDHLKLLCEDQFPSIKGVSRRSFQRLRAKIEREDGVVLTKVTNPDAFKSKYRLTGSNSHPVARLNELWQIDASPADVMCVDGRHSVYLCVDIFSRRLIVYVSKTPRAEAVALLMRRAILAWGVPERVHTDNGSDFVARSTQRLFAALGIEVELSRPFQPQEKGHVERAVRTFQHDLAPLLSGFIGHNVADRKVIEERRAFSQRLGLDDAGALKPKYTGAELQAICDDWAAGRYANRPHSGLEGATPFQVAAAFSGVVRKIDDVRALDLLLAPIAGGGDGTRIVTKKGVRIDHSYYLAPNVMPETRVFVRMDPEDMGRAWLFSADGAEFLGEAICPELAGIDPKAAVMEARAQQKRFLDERTAQLRADMKNAALEPRHMVDVVVRDAAKEAGKLVEFPKPAESYTTPGLDAARAALGEEEISREEALRVMRGIDAFVDRNRREVENDLIGEQAAEGENVQPLRKESTPQQRMALARDIDRRLYKGEEVSQPELVWFEGCRRNIEFISLLADAKERFRHALFLMDAKKAFGPLWPHEDAWLKSYVSGAEYKALNDVFEDFGEHAVR